MWQTLVISIFVSIDSDGRIWVPRENMLSSFYVVCSPSHLGPRPPTFTGRHKTTFIFILFCLLCIRIKLSEPRSFSPSHQAWQSSLKWLDLFLSFFFLIKKAYFLYKMKWHWRLFFDLIKKSFLFVFNPKKWGFGDWTTKSRPFVGRFINSYSINILSSRVDSPK